MKKRLSKEEIAAWNHWEKRWAYNCSGHTEPKNQTPRGR